MRRRRRVRDPRGAHCHRSWSASLRLLALTIASAAIATLAMACTPPATPTPSPEPSPTTMTDTRERRWSEVDSWVYQLTGYPDDRLDEIAASAYDLAVIDLSRDGGESTFTAGEIAAVQATGKLVLAYFEIGAIEDYRPEWPEIPDTLKLGPVEGWPGEHYVAYWDERWWPVVRGRLDRALDAGFDGAYLDLVTAYAEIPADAAGTDREDLARRMVALLARIADHARMRDPTFKIVPQNAPELHAYAGYLEAIDGLGMEELYVLATDEPCAADWCAENRAAAAAIRDAGKLVLTVDYATEQRWIDHAYTAARAAGFVPYVTDVDLDTLRVNPGWSP